MTAGINDQGTNVWITNSNIINDKGFIGYVDSSMSADSDKGSIGLSSGSSIVTPPISVGLTIFATLHR